MSAFRDAVLAAPFAGAALTLALYALACRLHLRLGRPLWAHPVLVAVLSVTLVLLGLGAPYDAYFATAEPLHLALGPLLVLLAVPLCRHLPDIRAAAPTVGLALTAGCAVALAGHVLLARALAAEHAVAASILPRSITTAAAVGVAEGLGGSAPLAAALVIATGIFGAVVGPAVLGVLRIRDHRAQGLALGVAAHVIGTVRAFQISPQAGAFAGIGMVLNAFLTIVLAPFAIAFLR
ncbi:LrgB family protein [Salinarimonas sp.]|uniref:LrgB family protein n=1 Tax=Salinarimonas sp. TaxID=2766526 RepID=UPI0032D93BB8